jgi:hypothetical protein
MLSQPRRVLRDYPNTAVPFRARELAHAETDSYLAMVFENRTRTRWWIQINYASDNGLRFLHTTTSARRAKEWISAVQAGI